MSLQSYEHLRFKYDHAGRPHIIEAINKTVGAYKSGKDCIGHDIAVRGGKSSIIHGAAVELLEAGAPFVHAVVPWNNLVSQLTKKGTIKENLDRMRVDGWNGVFNAHGIGAIPSAGYWRRHRLPGREKLPPWTLIASTIHLVHHNKITARDAVRLAIEECNGRPVFIIDETHLIAEGQEWWDTMSSMASAGAFVVSLTGTSSRADAASIMGFDNIPTSEWEAHEQVVVTKMGETFVRDSDGLLVRWIDRDRRKGQKRTVVTKATGVTVTWEQAFKNKWLQPVSGRPVDFDVLINDELVPLSSVKPSTARKHIGEWVRSTECCRALAEKAVAELWDWRKDHKTSKTKMLVVTTADNEASNGFGSSSQKEKTANAHAREMRRQIMAAIESSPLAGQGLCVEICTSVDENGETDVAASRKLNRFTLESPDEDGQLPIDILIVKTMGIVGLDSKPCKILVDASSIRRGPMKKQLGSRNLTRWKVGENFVEREAVTIYPCDPDNHDFYGSLGDTSKAQSSKEVVWEESDQDRIQSEVKQKEGSSVVDGSGRLAGYQDESGRWVEGDHDAIIEAVRNVYPVARLLRAIDIVEAYAQGAFPLTEDQLPSESSTSGSDLAGKGHSVVSSGDQPEGSDEGFGKRAIKKAGHYFSYSESTAKWKRLVRTLQRMAKEYCRISPDISVDKIEDPEVKSALIAALDIVEKDAVREVSGWAG